MVNHFCVQKYSQMLPSQITFAAEVSEYIVEQLCWVFFRYNRCPHHCLNGHEQFAVEIFFWWWGYRLLEEHPSGKGTTRKVLQSIARRYEAKLNTLLDTFRQFGLKDTPSFCRTGCWCLFGQFPPRIMTFPVRIDCFSSLFRTFAPELLEQWEHNQACLNYAESWQESTLLNIKSSRF